MIHDILSPSDEDLIQLSKVVMDWGDCTLVDDVTRLSRLLDTPDLVESCLCDVADKVLTVLLDECFRRFALSCGIELDTFPIRPALSYGSDLDTPPISSQPVRQCPECNGASGTPRRQMGAPFL